MRRRHADLRFEILAPAVRRATSTTLLDGAPLFVPIRVIPSTAPVVRQVTEHTGTVDVTLADGTQLHFAAGVSAAFVVEILCALRPASC